jgi:hypothetical protein
MRSLSQSKISKLLAKLKMSNIVQESKIIKKGEQIFPNVITKLESGNPLRKGSPKSSIDNFKCFPSMRGTPPLHDQLESVK